MFNTPILFLIYNRPDLTYRVFCAIKEIQPKYLYIAADGPSVQNEDVLCQDTRNIVLNNIDWPCEVKTLFRETNMGCKIAVSEAITWFFDNVEEGIILEDDTLPNSSFFNFCSTLLEKYRFDCNIMHIGGTSFYNKSIQSSYYFTRYTHIWGWATWKRAWFFYDVKLMDWPILKGTTFLLDALKEKQIVNYWNHIFDVVYENKFDTWDYQWSYACWKNRGLSIAPAKNLISNIGFSENATHTKIYNPLFANLMTYDIVNIKDPAYIDFHDKADSFIRDKIYLGRQNFIIIFFKNLINVIWRKSRS